MSSNHLGDIFRVTSFGESHGAYVGCVVEGCPAGLLLDMAAIQFQVNRRKASSNHFSTQRHEEDTVEIISGLLDNRTLGSPITILIKNTAHASSDYDTLKDIYRPNHADYTTEQKYGIRDHRGGGRSSIRITAAMVAAGAIAEQLILHYYPTQIVAHVSSIHNIVAHTTNTQLTRAIVDSNELRWIDTTTLDQVQELITQTKALGDTLGGTITCTIQNVPIGLGEPIFNKLQAVLAHAMLSINTVKGFEYGDGFDATLQKGSEHNDAFVQTDNRISTETNHSGGIQGGISNGQPIYFKVAFKPISSIQKMQRSINKKGDNIDFEIQGRHDVCAVPRAVAIVEAYTSIVIADMVLKHKLNKIA